MSHFAKVLEGRVIEVIAAEPEFFNSFRDTSPGTWIQTSYNTRENRHWGADGQPDGGQPLRGNFAGRGMTYDQENDVFYAPRPYASWHLDTATWTWQPPVPYPQDTALHVWSESGQTWIPYK